MAKMLPQQFPMQHDLTGKKQEVQPKFRLPLIPGVMNILQNAAEIHISRSALLKLHLLEQHHQRRLSSDSFSSGGTNIHLNYSLQTCDSCVCVRSLTHSLSQRWCELVAMGGVFKPLGPCSTSYTGLFHN